jgi:hypothetical protein
MAQGKKKSQQRHYLHQGPWELRMETVPITKCHVKHHIFAIFQMLEMRVPQPHVSRLTPAQKTNGRPLQLQERLPTSLHDSALLPGSDMIGYRLDQSA